MAIFKEHLIYEKIRESGFPFAHCSNITQLDDYTLMAQWYSGKGEQNKNQSIFASKYDVKDNKWSEPYLLSKTTEYPEGNGVLWKDSVSNKLFFFYATIWTHSIIKKSFGRGWFHCKLFYRISMDDGVNWGPITTMKDEVGYMFRNKPLRLKDGRILVPMYNENPPMGFMAISDDDGDSFHFSDYIKDDPKKHPPKKKPFMHSGNEQPTIIELDNGQILALLRTTLHKQIFRSVSDDRGETWSPAEAIHLPNPGSGTDLVKLKSGKMLLIFNNSESGRHNMTLAINTDAEGINWKIVKVLEDDPKLKFSYPAIIQTTDGMIHATYTYNRKTIKHVYFDEEWLF